MKKLVLYVMAAFSTLAGTTAHADDVAADIRMSPASLAYVYGYASCVFDERGGPAEERIENCREFGEAISEGSRDLLADWHRREVLKRQREMERAFGRLEAEALLAEKQNKRIPQQIIRLLGCYAETITAQENFARGVSIDFDLAEGTCRNAIFGIDGYKTEAAALLHRRLRVGTRYINVVGAIIPEIEFRYGLMDLKRLPDASDTVEG